MVEVSRRVLNLTLLFYSFLERVAVNKVLKPNLPTIQHLAFPYQE